MDSFCVSFLFLKVSFKCLHLEYRLWQDQQSGKGPQDGVKINMVLNVHRNHKAIRDGENGGKGLWRWVKRENIYLSSHCHHHNDSCIEMGSDESHFNVSLIVRDEVTNHNAAVSHRPRIVFIVATMVVVDAKTSDEEH